MADTIELNTSQKPVVQPIELAPATTTAPAATAPTSLMLMAFEIYKLAAVLGLQISRNERASSDDNKKMFKHWSKVGVDSTKGQGSAGAWVAVAAFAVTFLSVTTGMVRDNHDQTVFQKASDLTSGVGNIWIQSYIATGQEASGKSSLIQTDLTNPARGADSFRSNVEETSKNVCQNVFQLVAQAARGG